MTFRTLFLPWRRWFRRVQVVLALLVLGLLLVAVATGWHWLAGLVTVLAFAVALASWWEPLQRLFQEIPPEQASLVWGGIAGLTGLIGLGVWVWGQRGLPINWDAVSALGESLGSVGQILVAVVAAVISWQQYVISKVLTEQQNRITQQQTIDAYFQGISELALDDQGLLEDWPQERMIAEGRTAALLSSVNAEGKAKVVRFLSMAKLLTPLKRDQRLGRPILDGNGLYQEDRENGERVINLGNMLAGADMAGTDLRRVDFSGADLTGTNFSHCNLTRTNFAMSNLQGAKFVGANLQGAIFFYGDPDKLDYASPCQPWVKGHRPNLQTGEFTGAIVEGADFTGAINLSEEQRFYLCSWGGPRTRSTIPGGCQGIPSKLYGDG
ncbi:MAG: pentapeptide repeat-containing protein [Gloeomargarita sp. SKYG116]|nr:pentapeptide repeat-containing protein [Gloeomargarita sp. SKYG116]MDW8400855.1 pentapeptide repeat-containing protein [Gloeomargarita sp. SKYGB_i_bin116]